MEDDLSCTLQFSRDEVTQSAVALVDDRVSSTIALARLEAGDREDRFLPAFQHGDGLQTRYPFGKEDTAHPKLSAWVYNGRLA